MFVIIFFDHTYKLLYVLKNYIFSELCDSHIQLYCLTFWCFGFLIIPGLPFWLEAADGAARMGRPLGPRIIWALPCRGPSRPSRRRPGRTCRPGGVPMWKLSPITWKLNQIKQTLRDSFSAVSKPNLASKYSLESSRRDLHNALLCTVFQSRKPRKRKKKLCKGLWKECIV